MKINLLFVFMLLAAANRGQAQEQLSLTQAISLGLANNFSIQIEEYKKLEAANNNNWGQAGAMPNVTLNMRPVYTYSRSESNSPFAIPGSNRDSNIDPAVNAVWTIFNGFNVRMNKEKLALLQEQSDGNAAIIVENTVQAIMLAYYKVLLERERTQVFKSSLGLSGDRYAYSKLKGVLGSAVTFDILKDKNSYLTDSANYITQVLNYRNAGRNLNLLLGRDVRTAYELTDSLRAARKVFVFDELAAKMNSSNSNLKNQYINQQILKRDIAIAKSLLYPNVSLNLSGGKSWSRRDIGNPIVTRDGIVIDAINANNLSLTASITLSYTLFNGGNIQRQIKNARIQERIGQLQVEDLKLTLNNDLISSHDTYNLRKSLMGIAADNLETAQLNLELGEERYRNGSINSFDYRALQITYLQTALSYYQSIYDLLETEIELMRLTGGILGYK